MKPATKHTHPHNITQQIFGHQLEAGDLLEQGDVYDSSNGYWERCPCPGLTLQGGIATVWIRQVPQFSASSVTDDEICSLMNTILVQEDLSVHDHNILRDCEIARGLTPAKPETILEAKGRVVRDINARVAEGCQ